MKSLRPSGFPTVSRACPRRPPHPHAFAHFPLSRSAFCLSVPVGRHLFREALPGLPPMAMASLSSAPLWLKLGHPPPCGSICLCPTLGMSHFSPGPAVSSFLWHSSTELSRVPPPTIFLQEPVSWHQLPGDGSQVQGGRNLDCADLRGEWEMRVWRQQVQSTGEQSGWSPEGSVRLKEGGFQDGRDLSLCVDGERGQFRGQNRRPLSGWNGPWPTDLETGERR